MFYKRISTSANPQNPATRMGTSSLKPTFSRSHLFTSFHTLGCSGLLTLSPPPPFQIKPPPLHRLPPLTTYHHVICKHPDPFQTVFADTSRCGVEAVSAWVTSSVLALPADVQADGCREVLLWCRWYLWDSVGDGQLVEGVLFAGAGAAGPDVVLVSEEVHGGHQLRQRWNIRGRGWMTSNSCKMNGPHDEVRSSVETGGALYLCQVWSEWAWGACDRGADLWHTSAKRTALYLQGHKRMFREEGLQRAEAHLSDPTFPRFIWQFQTESEASLWPSMLPNTKKSDSFLVLWNRWFIF